MSFPIDWTPDQAKSFIQDQVEQAAQWDPWLIKTPPQIRYTGFRAKGWVMPEVGGSSSLAAILGRCHHNIMGRELVRDAFPGTADARYFRADLGEQVIYYGPSGGNIHAPDEYVELKTVLEVSRVLSRFIISWCG